MHLHHKIVSLLCVLLLLLTLMAGCANTPAESSDTSGAVSKAGDACAAERGMLYRPRKLKVAEKIRPCNLR